MADVDTVDAPKGPTRLRVRVSEGRVLDFVLQPDATQVDVDLTGEDVGRLVAISTDAQGVALAAGAEVKLLPRQTATLLPDVQARLAQAIHAIDLDRADALEQLVTDAGALPLLIEEINALRAPDRLAHRTLQLSKAF